MFNDSQQQIPTQDNPGATGNEIQSGTAPAAAQPQAAVAQPPVAAPAAAQPQAPAVPTTTPASSSKSPGLHHFISSVLGALSGTPPPQYTTDPNGKLVAMPPPAQTNRQKVGRLASTLLSGLAAGSQVPEQKSGLANLAAGLGAGADAIGKQNQQQDQANKQQAREDFEQEQQMTLRKMEIAKGNALRFSLHQDSVKKAYENTELANKLDTQRTENEAVAKQLETNHDVHVRYMTATEAEKELAADHNFIVSHKILPLGFKPMLDNDGNPIFDADGQPKNQGRVAVIDGLHDGKIPITKAFADDVQKYGDLAGVKNYDSIREGDEYEMKDYTVLENKILEAQKKEAQGWADAEEGFGGKDGKTPGKINKVTIGKTGFDAFRPNPAGVEGSKQAETVANIAEKQQQVATGKSTEAKNYAEAEKARAEANQQKQFNPSGAAGLAGDAYLKSLPQEQQSVLTSIAEGRNNKAMIQNRKGELTPLGEALMRAYPDYDVTKAKSYEDLRKDFITGPSSKALTAYGTAINHARALYDNTGPNSYIPGTAENKRYNQDITYVATEVAKALNPTGVATEGAIKEQEDALRSTFNRKSAIENAEHILTGKMAEMKQRWANGQVRPSYQPPMPGLSQEAIGNADYIRNHGKVSQPQATPQAGQVPAGGQPILRNGQTVGYILNGQRVNF